MSKKEWENGIVKYLNQVFIYTKERKDKWTILKKAPFEGDCEDYSLTILWHISGRMWKSFWWSQITGKAKLLICTLPNGVSHVVLQYDGMCIDNIQKRWVTKGYMISEGYKFYIFLWPLANTALNMTFRRRWL